MLTVFRFWLCFSICFNFINFRHFINADEFLQKDLSSILMQKTNFKQKNLHFQNSIDHSENILPTCASSLDTKGTKAVIETWQVKSFGLTSKSKQLQMITDAFDNEIAVWITDGIIYASTKINEAEWQAVPDSLSSLDETVSEFQLGADSIGNVFVIWQAMPTQSIQVATRSQASYWQTQEVAHLEKNTSLPQIAAGDTGYAIAAWKADHQEIVALQIAEIPLPLSLIDCHLDETETLNDRLFSPLTNLPSNLNNHMLLFNESESLTDNSSESVCIEDCSELPSALPFPPKDLRGHQVANKFATQTDLVNIITWKSADRGLIPIAYYIYRDSSLHHLVAIIPADRELKFKDHNRKKHRTYSYFIIAVDTFGTRSPPIGIIFKESKTHIVSRVLPISIAIKPINPSIAIETTQQFIAIVKFSDGSIENLTDVTWCSSNPRVATINSNGLAIGLTKGTTIICAILKGVSASTTLMVTCPPITITTTLLPNGVVGMPYSQTIQTSGGLAPITFSIVSGNLPTGLSLDPSSGIISGIPISAGTFQFTVRAAAVCGNFIDQILSITIITCPPITITTTVLSNGVVGTPYSQTIQTSGGLAPITFSIVSGNLPTGLSLDPSSGIISGTPTSASFIIFIVRATSNCGNFADQEFNIGISPSLPFSLRRFADS